MWTLRREAARVVLLDAESRVLLLEAKDPTNPGKGSWWELPGGGVEHGEASEVAAARELYEETGIDAVEMGPCVWRHHARFTFAGYRFDQNERIHLARLAVPDGHPESHRIGHHVTGDDYRPPGLEAIEALAFKGVRWWSEAELHDLVRGGGKVIPPWLPEQLSAVLRDGVPDEPIDLGELGDAI